jgi:UDP-glucose 4-epimerase
VTDQRRAFVIGAQGFVGSHATRALLRDGWAVTAFGPPMSQDGLADVSGQIETVPGSVADPAALTQAVKDSGAGVVISFAAFSSGDGGLAKAGEQDAARAFEINVEGLRHTLDAALGAGVGRVLWASSTTLYGPAVLYPDQPIDEDAPFRPQLTYGLTKAMAELLSDFYRDRTGLEAVSVRLPLVFGPGLWYRGAAAALVALFEAACGRVPHTLRGPKAMIDLMYAPDAGRAFSVLAGHPGGLAGRYNINGFTTTFPEIAATVAGLAPGFTPIFEETPAPVTYPLITAERIARDTGFRPAFTLKDAAADYLETLKER